VPVCTVVQITAFKEPSIPPPPLPTQTWQPTSAVQQTSTAWQVPAQQPQKAAWNSGAVSNHTASTGHQESDEWDDDWDDDDDDNSSNTDAPAVTLLSLF